MIRRVCNTFLTAAARRWPADLRDTMLAEWQAELHVLPTPAQRLRYAASLATSRPHREPVVVTRPGRNFAHAVLSFVLLAALPVLYLELALGWTTAYSDDTIARQAWLGAGSGAGAVVLGIVCARLTTGVTQLIRPVVLPLWCFGVLFVTLAALPLLDGHLPNRSHLASMALWALCAVALCALAIRARRAMLSWAIVVFAVPVSFWFLTMSFELIGTGYLLGDSLLGAYLFTLAVRTPVHVTIFLLVYANHLARQHRAATASEERHSDRGEGSAAVA